MDPIKPRHTGSLISKEAAEELERQDAARRYARAGTREERYNTFRTSFLAAHLGEMEFAMKWGAEADTIPTAFGEEVAPGGRISDKYPPRRYGRLETWIRKWKTRKHQPVFQWEPRLNGLILNEGGRGFTLTMTRMVPFRLYIAGYVLNRAQNGTWSFSSFGKWEDGILAKLGWVRRK